MNLRCLPLAACLLLTAAWTQSAPPSQPAFSAKVRIAHYLVSSPGHRTLIGTEAGVYLRAADGATMVRTHAVAHGKTAPDTAVFTDSAGNVYRVSWAAHQAILIRDGGGAKPAALPLADPGPRFLVNGISCVMKTVLAEGCGVAGPPCHSGQTPADANESCFSPEYGLSVHSDQIVYRRETIETIRDVYDLVPAVPDAAEVSIPSGFTQSREISTLPLLANH